QIDVSLEPRLPQVPMDEAQLRQALLNLLRNAREAMPDGGRVTVTAERAEGGVAIRVTDRGVGVSEENRARIFDLFFTTKERGTGLGLPLTQQIVVAHGGRVSCENNRSAGAT